MVCPEILASAIEFNETCLVVTPVTDGIVVAGLVAVPIGCFHKRRRARRVGGVIELPARARRHESILPMVIWKPMACSDDIDVQIFIQRPATTAYEPNYGDL